MMQEFLPQYDLISSPHEAGRWNDAILFKKQVGGVETDLVMNFSPSGVYTDSLLTINEPNLVGKPETIFQIGKRSLSVSCRFVNTEFPIITFNHQGKLSSIKLTTLEDTEYAFWRDAPTLQDLDILEREVTEIENAVDEFEKLNVKNEFFTDSFRAKFVGLGKLTREFEERLALLKELDRQQQLVLLNQKGVWRAYRDQGRGIRSSRRYSLVGNVEPGKEFRYDGGVYALNEFPNFLSIFHENERGNRYKLIVAQNQINYNDIKSVIYPAVDWDDIVKLCRINYCYLL